MEAAKAVDEEIPIEGMGREQCAENPDEGSDCYRYRRGPFPCMMANRLTPWRAAAGI